MTGTERTGADGSSRSPGQMTEAEFRSLYQRLRDELPWGADDRRGALNYITASRSPRGPGRGHDGPHGLTGRPCGALGVGRQSRSGPASDDEERWVPTPVRGWRSAWTGSR